MVIVSMSLCIKRLCKLCQSYRSYEPSDAILQDVLGWQLKPIGKLQLMTAQEMIEGIRAFAEGICATNSCFCFLFFQAVDTWPQLCMTALRLALSLLTTRKSLVFFLLFLKGKFETKCDLEKKNPLWRNALLNMHYQYECLASWLFAISTS